MNKLAIAKLVVSGIVSVGVGAVTKNAISATTPIELNPYQKVTVAIGTAVVSSTLCALASKHATKKIDDIAEGYESITAQMQAAAKAKLENE